MINGDAALHEAAHVVVGCALGLRLRLATISQTREPNGDPVHGFAWFRGYEGQHDLAFAVMYAAGVVWEKREGHRRWGRAHEDRRLARAALRSEHDFRTAVRIADEMLIARMGVVQRVASALCDRDLRQPDIDAMVIE